MSLMKPSIRRKIAFGYLTIILMVMGVSVVTLAEMEYVKQKMLFGGAVHAFLDTINELKRFEKNYLLYERRADYPEIVRYIDQADDLLGIKSNRFDAIASFDQINNLQSLLHQYRDFLAQFTSLLDRRMSLMSPADEARKGMIEFRLRTVGDAIVAAALNIERDYRHSIIEASNETRRVLLYSIAALILVAIIAGRVLSRIVLKPLRRIETTMDEIAGGQIVTIGIDSRDQEIVSLVQAFNRMIRELELRQRHLIQSEKLSSLGTLLSGVAHELNNPLWNISSSNQILMEKGEDGTPEFRKIHLAQIEEQTDRARNIVQSLLEFSRSGDFKKQALPLGNVIEDTLRLVRGQLPPGVTVQVDVPAGLSITADKQRIQQVFINLVKNAGQAIVGEGVISIKAWKHRAIDKTEDNTAIVNYLKYRGKCTLEVDTVDIEVHDTGQGIPHEDLSKIFDPFFTTKDVGKGSGLGLYIVHEIIEEHDGCIAVDSSPDRGTSFLLRLPA